MNPLHKRIYEISYKNKLSHISSCISVADIADKLFKAKNPNDLIILSKGHGGVGFYTCLEKYLGINAEELLKKYGIHPKLDKENGIFVSSGSLGQGICAALGYALADKNRTVHCIISDGEWYSGRTLESIVIAGELNLDNLFIHIDSNGYGAYKTTDTKKIAHVSKYLFKNVIIHPFYMEDVILPCYNGLDYHYYIMTEKDWDLIKDL